MVLEGDLRRRLKDAGRQRPTSLSLCVKLSNQDNGFG